MRILEMIRRMERSAKGFIPSTSKRALEAVPDNPHNVEPVIETKKGFKDPLSSKFTSWLFFSGI
jgi:hypothetical protein